MSWTDDVKKVVNQINALASTPKKVKPVEEESEAVVATGDVLKATKPKGKKISNGLGLSKGNTGLQV